MLTSPEVKIFAMAPGDKKQRGVRGFFGELVMLGLHRNQDRKARLQALMEEGHERAKQTHPSLNPQGVVDIIHQHRGR